MLISGAYSKVSYKLINVFVLAVWSNNTHEQNYNFSLEFLLELNQGYKCI